MTADQENTFRSLKDEPLLRTRVWCTFGFHKWTKWTYPDTNSGYAYAKVERLCVSCGEYQFKKVRIS